MNAVTLVTGGAGFVGRHLVRMLRERGERVRVFDLAEPAHEDDVQGSVTDDKAVARAIENVSSVFHLAGNAQLWAKDARVFDEVNRAATEIVAAAALNAGVQRFVHCSSLTTLIGRKTPIGVSTADETVRQEPEDMLGPYPRSKLMAERLIEDYAKRGLDTVIALPTEPLGAGDDSLTPPTQMILDFANRKTPAYIDCILNFVPVASLAEGLIAARDSGRVGERYLLGGDSTPMIDLLMLIERLTRHPMPKTKLPYAVALAAGIIDTKLVAPLTGKPPKAPLTGVRLAGRRVSFSSEKAARDLGWRASPLQPALEETLNWARGEGLLKDL